MTLMSLHDNLSKDLLPEDRYHIYRSSATLWRELINKLDLRTIGTTVTLSTMCPEKKQAVTLPKHSLHMSTLPH